MRTRLLRHSLNCLLLRRATHTTDGRFQQEEITGRSLSNARRQAAAVSDQPLGAIRLRGAERRVDQIQVGARELVRGLGDAFCVRGIALPLGLCIGRRDDWRPRREVAAALNREGMARIQFGSTDGSYSVFVLSGYVLMAKLISNQ